MMFALGEICGALALALSLGATSFVCRALDRRKEAKRKLAAALRAIRRAETLEACQVIAGAALIGIEP